jgi:hypothetical protein
MLPFRYALGSGRAHRPVGERHPLSVAQASRSISLNIDGQRIGRKTPRVGCVRGQAEREDRRSAILAVRSFPAPFATPATLPNPQPRLYCCYQFSAPLQTAPVVDTIWETLGYLGRGNLPGR